MPTGIYKRTEYHNAISRKNGFQKGHKIHLGKKLKPNQGFQKKEKHWNWQGEDVGYVGIHQRIKNILGDPRECEHCETTIAKIYDWANKDHKYKINLEDWIRLCRKCHMKHDKENNNRLTYHII